MANKVGTKYRKIGIATTESLAQAAAFMTWFAAHDVRRLIHGQPFDEDVAQDTFIKIYEHIALKGYTIDNFRAYYSSAYRTELLRSRTFDPLHLVEFCAAHDTSASDFDYDSFELENEAFRREVMEYVCANYDAVAVSLFEIYIALQPDMSYKKLAEMLDYPAHRIWQNIGAIKKDLIIKYRTRMDFLLTLM